MSMTRKPLVALAGALALVGAVGCARHAQSSTPAEADSVSAGFGGAQRKDKVSGAVTSISGDNLKARPMRLEELLRSRVPGVVIRNTGPGGFTIRLRGTNSQLVDQEPLVIVDGVMMQTGNLGSALAGLAPDDIKRIDVVRDLANTAIYGQRGAGGVILITTKPGSEREEQHR
jgi:TonB-dependent starch-binding outer membrane protein SusC